MRTKAPVEARFLTECGPDESLEVPESKRLFPGIRYFLSNWIFNLVDNILG